MNMPNSNITVSVLEGDDPIWNQIESNSTLSLYHRREWMQLVENTFANRGYYIVATHSGGLLDVLPLFLITHPIMGKKLISTPYEGCHGGFSSSDSEVKHKMISKIMLEASRLDVKYVEIRTMEPVKELEQYGFKKSIPFIVSEIELLNNKENFSMLSPKHRRNVRNAEKKGVTVVQASKLSQMDVFYEILSKHYKDLGVPFFGRGFFKNIWKNIIMKGHADLLLGKIDNEIIGGHLLFFSGSKIISKYSACIRNTKLRQCYASYALFWAGISRGIAKQCSVFNLGITGKENQGLLDFKTRFGAESKPVHFYSLPVSGKTPDYAKYYNSYNLHKKVWKNLPIKMTNMLGHEINKWIC